MASVADKVNATCSTLIRLGAYVFLRWIPTSIVPPALVALFVIYLPTFFSSYQQTSPYKEVIDIIDQKRVEKPVNGHTKAVVEETEETEVLEEKDAKIRATLLWGRPSPSSQLWTIVTLAINILLAGMVADRIYRAPLLHPAHDLSFARVGYVSDSTANLLVREPHLNATPVTLHYRHADAPISDGPLNLPNDQTWKSAGEFTASQLSNETDFTGNFKLTGLKSDVRYQYLFSNNHTGYFRTAPATGRPSKHNDGIFTFLHSSCLLSNVPYNPLNHALALPGFNHLAAWIPKLKAHFMLFLGDFIYIDVPLRLGSSVSTYRRGYRQVYSSPEWPSVSADLPWLHVYDDHEISNDWDGNTTGVYPAAFDPYYHYQLTVNPPAHRRSEPYYSSFDQGLASFFMLDTRRYRTPSGEGNSTDPSKTMLGEQQLTDLLTWIHKSPPRGIYWKIIISSIPFTQNWKIGSGEDTWGGYMHERRQILEAMWDAGASGVGVVVLSGDRHEFAATAFPPPKDGKWPQEATVHEFSTSPLSMFYLPTRTYKEYDPETDVCVKYYPTGNSKFGAIELTTPEASNQGVLKYRLFVDGEEVWDHVITTPERTNNGFWDSLWG